MSKAGRPTKAKAAATAAGADYPRINTFFGCHVQIQSQMNVVAPNWRSGTIGHSFSQAAAFSQPPAGKARKAAGAAVPQRAAGSTHDDEEDDDDNDDNGRKADSRY